jgi:hypothetical protein
MALIATGALLVLLLGIAGFAVGRSLRTPKEQAANAGRLSMTRAFDASFRSAYDEGDRAGFGRGLPEGERLGSQRGVARGRRHGELVRARRLLRQAVRRGARGMRRVAHRPHGGAPSGGRRAVHRRKPHKPRHRVRQRVPRERRSAERESLRGEGAVEPREREANAKAPSSARADTARRRPRP